MKVLSLLVVFAVLVLIPIVTRSQSNSPQSPVEISGEPRHHPKFENEFVRIWDVTVPAGDATLWHAHRNDNVVVTLGDASLRIENAAAPPVEAQWKFGEVRFSKATYIHRAMNVGATPFHNLTIELLKQPIAPAGVTALKEGVLGAPILENDRVRVYRVSLGPGESIAMHTHSVIGMGISLSPAEVIFDTMGKGPQKTKVAAGDIRWRDGAVTHSVKNIGTTRFEAADIELK